jgi:mRNA interferase MazF
LTLNSGDVAYVELGPPTEREAGYRHPTVIVTAQAILDASPTVVHVIPVTSTLRSYATEVELEPEPGNGLVVTSAAQCQHVRSVSPARLSEPIGNVGVVALTQIREMLAVVFDLPQ